MLNTQNNKIFHPKYQINIFFSELKVNLVLLVCHVKILYRVKNTDSCGWSMTHLYRRPDIPRLWSWVRPLSNKVRSDELHLLNKFAFKTLHHFRQHCCLNICSYFGWVWQILNLRRAGFSSPFCCWRQIVLRKSALYFFSHWTDMEYASLVRVNFYVNIALLPSSRLNRYRMTLWQKHYKAKGA